MKPLLIEHPEEQSPSRRWGYRALTLLLWALFAYFFRPFLTLAVWLLGYMRFQEVMIEAHGWEDLLQLLLAYGLVILTITLVIIAWSLYNLLRYGRHEKRVNLPEPVTVHQLADYYGVPKDCIKHWRGSRRVELDFDDQGIIREGSDCRSMQQDLATDSSKTSNTLITAGR